MSVGQACPTWRRSPSDYLGSQIVFLNYCCLDCCSWLLQFRKGVELKLNGLFGFCLPKSNLANEFGLGHIEGVTYSFSYSKRLEWPHTSGILYSPMGQCLNYLFTGFHRHSKNVRHFYTLKWFEQPHLLRNKNGRGQLVV